MSEPIAGEARLPLQGIVVVDAARMLPAAILDRLLVDLGARVIKIESPDGGDPMRHLPPLAGRTGAAFAYLLRGAQSVALDLRASREASALRRLLAHGDVFVESFRPGTLAAWGLDPAGLLAEHPRLVVCSLPGFGAAAGQAPAHDLNFVAATGALDLLGPGVPGVQLADVGAALLAGCGILAALLARGASGRGAWIEQPLVTGPLPFLAWAWAEAAAGGGGLAETVMRGTSPAYRRYACADGTEVAVGALEPKYWVGLLDALGLPELTTAALAGGAEAEAAAATIAAAFAKRPRHEWLDLAERAGLPITPVETLPELVARPTAAVEAWLEAIALPGGASLRMPGPFVPSLGRSPQAPAPRLGQDTESVLAELAEA